MVVSQRGFPQPRVAIDADGAAWQQNLERRALAPSTQTPHGTPVAPAEPHIGARARHPPGSRCSRLTRRPGRDGKLGALPIHGQPSDALPANLGGVTGSMRVTVIGR